MLFFVCPSCQRRFDASSEYARIGRCPDCRMSLQRLADLAPLPPASPLDYFDNSLASADTLCPPTNPVRPRSPLTELLAPPLDDGELGRLGAYRVLSILGQGGMGVVFRAEDPRLRRFVAIKALLPERAGDPTARKRFLREARAVAGLKHANVITVYEVGEENGSPYLVMELLEGESLETRLLRQPRLSLVEILFIGRGIACGLAAAHERNLIHRDIKPANVFLEGPQAHVKILDFGLARAITGDTNLTESGIILGTPHYMAPEQIESTSVDHRCDLFALGCVLYRAATGEMAFPGTDALEVMSELLARTPPAPNSRDRSVPQPLSDLIEALLAKNPDDRPQTAQAVASALDSIPTASETRIHPRFEVPAPALPPNAEPPAHSRRWAILFAVGVATALALGAWAAFVGTR